MKKNVLKAGMVDVSGKEMTKRIAEGFATISMSPEAFKALMNENSPKGNVLETAKIAGIMAAKSTPDIIPLCHPLALSKVFMRFDLKKGNHSVEIFSEVVCLGPTGVEMEALAAVSVAALTIYDMMKWCDQTMIISDIKLLKKSGGASGDFQRKP